MPNGIPSSTTFAAAEVVAGLLSCGGVSFFGAGAGDVFGVVGAVAGLVAEAAGLGCTGAADILGLAVATAGLVGGVAGFFTGAGSGLGAGRLGCTGAEDKRGAGLVTTVLGSASAAGMAFGADLVEAPMLAGSGFRVVSTGAGAGVLLAEPR